MFTHRSRMLLVFAASLGVAACSGADEAEPMDEAPVASEDAPLTQAEIASAVESLSCYVQGDMGETATRPSPLHQTPIVLGRDVAKICYGAPSANGRTIMGGLVPYGQPWRLGANEATALHIPFEAELGDVDLEPGSYSLYAVPDEDEWEIYVTPMYERWGIPITDEIQASAVGSVEVEPETTDQMVETFTIEWVAEDEDEGHLVMSWENTRIRIPLSKDD